ncbi:MAG: Alpha-methylacyl-CoA racemase [Pseudonocardiales bacterium]|nr:Alpha-methylacyl-CoA racemase [Pseudonocardiales bacterium]
MTGPLAGVKVVELAGMGPGPHAALLLADLGADVVRVQRVGAIPGPDEPADYQHRSRRVLEADLKNPADLGDVLRLVAHADVLIEGFRPGVTERMGLGPADCEAVNPRLVYARMTGWGQTGPDAMRAGHDINYISGTGVLNAIGRNGEAPLAPLNLVGDFGGGSLYLVVGILAALVERDRSGQGQVIDAAIVDGTSHLAHVIWSQRGRGRWNDARGTNTLDSGAPFYDVYETADGKYMAVGALEPKFYAELLTGLDLDPSTLPAQRDQSQWPLLRSLFTEKFAGHTRAEWTTVFAGTDACVTPVLSFDEASSGEHLAARGTLVEIGGVTQPAPAPRFSRTPAATPRPPASVAEPLQDILASWT